jgi:hypothetical protein
MCDDEISWRASSKRTSSRTAWKVGPLTVQTSIQCAPVHRKRLCDVVSGILAVEKQYAERPRRLLNDARHLVAAHLAFGELKKRRIGTIHGFAQPMCRKANCAELRD